ncbi:uncharacterized protein LOC142627188 [Castanea sativa]|uniref:uncharacterized protein LOC142627188 n=1 Tax=Castanea sativa TaxID=21020 RepID=UPI003F649C1D
MAETKVSSLINPDLGLWKSKEVKRVFLPHEASLVLGIPLSHRKPPNHVSWSCTPSEEFSTSSAYKLLTTSASTDQAISSNQANQRRIWKGIWKMQVPNKIKHFVWRIFNNALPTKCNLKRRHIIDSDLRELCKDTPEDALHAMCFYNQVRDEPRTEMFATIAWCLWNRINSLHFGRPAHPLSIISAVAVKLLQELIASQSTETPIPRPPARGALFLPIPLSASVADMEALACLRAVQFAAKLDLHYVVFEGDSATVISAVSQGISLLSSFGNIVDDVRLLLPSFSSVTFSHVNCTGNIVADALAKKASSNVGCQVWMNALPSDIAALVDFDVH